MKRKLLFVVNVDWFFLSHRLPIALKALREGYEVHIATTLTKPAKTMEDLGLVVHPLKMERSSVGIVATLRLLLDLRRLFARIKPDVVHLVTIKPAVFGGLVARWTGVPAVVMAVSGLGFVFMAQGNWAAMRRNLVGLLYRLAMGHPNLRVIVQNRDDMLQLTRYADIREDRVSLIRGSGVDLDSYPCVTKPAGPPVVLMAARLLADKGVLEFVAAARALRGYRGARFVVVGDIDSANPASFKLKDVQAWVNDDILEWLGYREDMPAVFSRADMVVLPSYREGLPKALIEAAACGRAVVTTDVPGCRDAVVAEETAIVVPARAVEPLISAIRRLLDDPQLCERMGRAGRTLAETAFDVEQVVKKHLAIYDELGAKP